ncbi:MAG: hypothetical protein A3I60_05780 [Sulfuricurvum sp. RIFCSPLOWO2_02_FULL_43_45]|nr:MAG: hypothetical protein A3I60_05780 [Sulfuricurvum sp. RIFCSPLOWO2_02_FULL_43_45]
MENFDLNDTDFCWKYRVYEIFQKEQHIEEFSGLLYHYTSLEGFIGILSNQNIWATEYSFLNDSSELGYGLSIVKKLLKKYIDENNDALVCKFFEYVLNYLNDEALIHQFFIASFSEHKDQLSQWKGYGRNGSGVSLGFDFKDLTRWKREEILDINIYIKPVIYEKEIQEKEITKILDLLMKHIKTLKTIDKIETIASCLAGFLIEKSIFFKSLAFQEENEWRIVYNNIGTSSVPRKDVKFRIVDSKILPYLELRLVAEKAKLPINEIVYGAKNNFDNLRKVLQHIFSNFDNPTKLPSLVGSNIPLQ